MMDYIPGYLHEKLQNEFFFLINNDFCVVKLRTKKIN